MLQTVARTGEDLHDFDLFADRALASEAHAVCLFRPLRAPSASTDRTRHASCPISQASQLVSFNFNDGGGFAIAASITEPVCVVSTAG